MWDRGLRGWNVKTSPFLDEIRAGARDEGRAEGRVEQARAMVFHLGRKKFGKPPSRKQQKALESLTDLGELEGLAEQLLNATSWADLLNGFGLGGVTCRGGGHAVAHGRFLGGTPQRACVAGARQ